MLSSLITLMGMECRVIFVAGELLLLPKVPDFLLLRVTDNTMTTDFLFIT